MRKIMVLVALLLSLVACGQAAGTQSSPNGSWKADNFTATVNNYHIEIRTGTVVYWDGSFEPNVKSFTSKATDEGMQLSLDTTKDFIVKNDYISFKFSAVGTTRTIKLKRA